METLLARTARAGNLLLAGTVSEVRGHGPIAALLTERLRALGSRVSPGPGVRYLFLSGEGLPAATPADLAGIAPETIVIDAAADTATPGLDRRAWGEPVDRPRPELTRHTAGGGDILLLSEPAAVPEAAANAGRRRIAWAREHMPVTRDLARALGAGSGLAGIRLGLCLILEPKTAVLALALREAGATVSVFAPGNETDPEVALALAAAGVRVLARPGSTPEQERAAALELLDEAPDYLIDDGSNLIRLAHTDRPNILATLRGAAEETTSGLRPLRVMAEAGELRVPVIAVNDARCKTLFDNAHGTGQSSVFAILELLARERPGIPFAGTRALVIGYGPVGRGVARFLTGLGAIVTISEVDPVRAAEATYDGLALGALAAEAGRNELIISATGIKNTLPLDVLSACADGTYLAVAGGVDEEIALADARAAGARREPHAEQHEILRLPGGPWLNLLAGGDGVNYTAGEGNPVEIMDLSFGVQLSALAQLHTGAPLAPGVHPLSRAADDAVAAAYLAAQNLPLDRASARQRESVAAWTHTRFSISKDNTP